MAFIDLYYTEFFNDGSLKEYYRLEGNSTDSKNTSNGVDTNISYVTGKFGQCASFNGTTSKITFSNNSNFNLGNTWSVAFWVYPNSLSSRVGVYDHGRSGVTVGEWCIEIGTGGGVNSIAVSTVGVFEMQCANALNVSGFQHVVVTKNGTGAGSFHCYVNATDKTLATNSAFTCVDNANDKHIGTAIGPGGFLNGKVDDLALFSRVLSATEVSSLYNGTHQFFSGSIL